MKNKKPSTFFICCCDNRIMPYQITDKNPEKVVLVKKLASGSHNTSRL
ncbi:hypothetical protein KAT92_04050 [Candidatus Babeliales bacterium]|nr:hypothetical protein [Candidatus Babeliales bacterium]